MRRKIAIPQLIGQFLMPISAGIVINSLLTDSNFKQFPLAIAFLLFANVLLLSHDISRNVIFLAFQGTYFLFLIAGPLLDAADGIDFFSSFSVEIVRKTYICYWLAAFAMWCYCAYKANRSRKVTLGVGRKNVLFRNCVQYTGTLIVKIKRICPRQFAYPGNGYSFSMGRKNKSEKHRKVYNYERIRFLAKVFFYISIIAYIVVTVDKIIFRQVYSLQSYYANYDISSNLPGLVVKISDCHLISLALFLATNPSKSEAKMPLLFFMGASALTILYGVRNVIILNALFLIVYFVIRNGNSGEVWLPKKIAVIGIILLPILMILLQAFDVIRRSIAFNVFDISELFSFKLVRDFFVSQSVSSYILPNAISNYTLLGGQPVPYTFGTLYTYLTQNMFTRFLTGVAAYGANSVESAMSSGNLGARLAYYMYRETFLTGTGMGGSFVADLYVDFSYVGVFVGTIFFCMIANKMIKIAMGGAPYTYAFVLVAFRWLVYMPRDSYFSWAMHAFSFMNILFVLMVMFLSRVKISTRGKINSIAS